MTGTTVLPNSFRRHTTAGPTRKLGASTFWLTNDEETYNYSRGLACRAAEHTSGCEQVKKGIWTAEEARKFILADQLKDSVEDMNPLCDKATMFTDLLNTAISEVNWQEIVEAFLTED